MTGMGPRADWLLLAVDIGSLGPPRPVLSVLAHGVYSRQAKLILHWAEEKQLMAEEPSAARCFARSSALFDKHGHLLEWDDGFLLEFRAAANLVKPGASFRDILRYTFDNDPQVRANLAANDGAEE